MDRVTPKKAIEAFCTRCLHGRKECLETKCDLYEHTPYPIHTIEKALEVANKIHGDK